MSKEITWSNQLGSRSRSPWLILAKNDTLYLFSGSNIPEVVAIAGSDYAKNGKWSHTTYRLVLADDVHAFPGRQGWETGTFREGIKCDSWLDAANYFRVTTPSFQQFLREWKPKAAEWYDNTEKLVTAIDGLSPTGANILAISFGGFTRRQREAGYWNRDLCVIGESSTEIARFSPDEYRVEGCTKNMCTIISHIHSSGHGGGYVSLRVAIPEGASLKMDSLETQESW